VAEVRLASGIDIRLESGEAPPLPPAVVAHLTAFSREALSNAVRHSGAAQIDLALSTGDGCLSLNIRDDGRGMPVKIDPGYGLRHMRDRARLLGGEVQFLPTTGGGTTVHLEFPIEDNG